MKLPLRSRLYFYTDTGKTIQRLLSITTDNAIRGGITCYPLPRGTFLHHIVAGSSGSGTGTFTPTRNLKWVCAANLNKTVEVTSFELSTSITKHYGINPLKSLTSSSKDTADIEILAVTYSTVFNNCFLAENMPLDVGHGYLFFLSSFIFSLRIWKEFVKYYGRIQNPFWFHCSSCTRPLRAHSPVYRGPLYHLKRMCFCDTGTTESKVLKQTGGLQSEQLFSMFLSNSNI